MAPGLQQDPGTPVQEAGAGWDGLIWAVTRDVGLTAVGTTQGGALVLSKMVNQITSAAASSAPFNGVALPAARLTLIGAEICILNAAPNPIQVYGQGSDTVNGAAGSTGVTMQANSIAYFICMAAPGVGGFTNGVWLCTGLGFGFATGGSAGFTTYSTQTGVTASTTQTAAGGTQIIASQAQISVCATIGNAVTLPPAKPGMEITLVNNGANAAGVFGATQAQGGQVGGDTIAGAGTAFSLAVTTPVIFYCFVAGNWVTK